jgi:hypothetical protein
MKNDATTRTPSSAERARKSALAEVKARADALEARQHSEGRKAASPRPPKPAKPGKGKQRPVRPVPTARKAPRSRRPDRPLSCLDAAAKVLAESGKPMRVAEVVETMEQKGLWKSKSGKTPAATLHAAVIREIAKRGAASRFVKKDRGLFAASGKGA